MLKPILIQCCLLFLVLFGQGIYADDLGSLPKTHFLLYFGRSDCSYCHEIAPILRQLSRETGIHVLAITLDGVPLPMFPDAKPDNGISLMVSGGNGITKIPTLYLIDRAGQQATLLAEGMVSAFELRKAIEERS